MKVMIVSNSRRVVKFVVRWGFRWRWWRGFMWIVE